MKSLLAYAFPMEETGTRYLIIGNLFRIPALLYDILLYGGILLTFLSIGMLIYGSLKKKEKKSRKVWLIALIVGVLMLLPIVCAMRYGLGESVA